MLKGTRIIRGNEARLYYNTIEYFRGCFRSIGFEEIIIPSIWEAETFENKISNETKNQIWKFQDKGNRNVCLIPEVTGIIQEMYDNEWSKSEKKPIKLFYISRCYRYEKPQAGRYREFTQFGIEVLGDPNYSINIIKDLLINSLNGLKIEYSFKDNVKRGLGYYIEDGFEIECPGLGAQKQIAGGGRYKQGIGWAIGIDRLLLLPKIS